MSKSISDIVTDVKICIDEIAANDAEFEDTQDDTELATIIKSKIPEALRFVYANADYSLLDPSVVLVPTKKETITDTDITKSTFTLPDNYLRLVYAKCESWNGYIGQEDLIMWNDKDYLMLSDPYCTGTAERPKGALAWNDKNKVLELYCLNGNGTATAGIMTEPEDTTDYTDSTTISIPARVYRAVIYYISGLVFVTYADQNKASMMFNEANDIIGFSQMASQSTVQEPQLQITQ